MVVIEQLQLHLRLADGSVRYLSAQVDSIEVLKDPQFWDDVVTMIRVAEGDVRI
jgi:hypothetical protein